MDVGGNGELKQPKETNWCVITGGPSSGNSTLLTHLSFLGFHTRPEAARVLVDEELSRGGTVAETRLDEQSFQLKVLAIKIAAEAREPKEGVLFWDRGMPDSIVYLDSCHADAEPARRASRLHKYRKVFLLDPLPEFTDDYARTENAELAAEIHDALDDCYSDLGYEVIHVPVGPVSERAKFVMENLKE